MAKQKGKSWHHPKIREQFMELLTAGLKTSEIAKAMGVTQRTVQRWIHRVYEEIEADKKTRRIAREWIPKIIMQKQEMVNNAYKDYIAARNKLIEKRNLENKGQIEEAKKIKAPHPTTLMDMALKINALHKELLEAYERFGLVPPQEQHINIKQEGSMEISIKDILKVAQELEEQKEDDNE